MLQAHLEDGSCLRFERFMDQGVVASFFEKGEVMLDEGQLYKGRRASASELVRPVNARELTYVAEAVGAEPYSVRRRNCHHFVLHFWNALVIASLRQRDYPDRVKSGLLRGVSRPFALLKLGTKSRSWSRGGSGSSGCLSSGYGGCTNHGAGGAAKEGVYDPAVEINAAEAAGEPTASRRPSEDELEGDGDMAARSTWSFGHSGCGGDSAPTSATGSLSLTNSESSHDSCAGCRIKAERPGLVAWRQEAGRIYGEWAAPRRRSIGYDHVARRRGFARLLEAGAFFLLEPGAAPQPLRPPQWPPEPCDGSDDMCHAWAMQWLRGLGEASVRLAERACLVDVAEVGARLASQARCCSRPSEASEGSGADISRPLPTEDDWAEQQASWLSGGGLRNSLRALASSRSLRGGEGSAAAAQLAAAFEREAVPLDDFVCVVLRETGGGHPSTSSTEVPTSTEEGPEATDGEVKSAVSGAPGLRLVIYAVLPPCQSALGERLRIRLVGGDVLSARESSYAVSLRAAPDGARAEDIMRSEVEAMHMFLMTGDAGFVTLL